MGIGTFDDILGPDEEEFEELNELEMAELEAMFEKTLNDSLEEIKEEKPKKKKSTSWKPKRVLS